jgi:prophage regulatory protein
MQNAISVSEGSNRSHRRGEEPRGEESLPDRWMRIDPLSKQIGLRKTWIYDAIKRGDFPAPIKIRGARVNLWSSRSIAAWQARQLEEEAA